MQKPDISIIIPAHNEENYIGATLQSVFASDFSGTIEVIVICNACTDRTEEFVSQTRAKVYDVPFKGGADAANYGAQKATADILVFLDADTTVSKNLLTDVFSAIGNGYVGGRTIVKWDGASLAAKIFSLVSYVHVHKWGGFCFVRKQVFEEVGGYKTGAKYGHDFDLGQRVSRGRKVAFLHKSHVVTSSRRFDKEGWGRHLWLALKRHLIDEKILARGVKQTDEIIYHDHR